MLSLILVLTQIFVSPPAQAIVLPSSATEIRIIEQSDVLKKTYAYTEFFEGLFSEQNFNQSYEMDLAYQRAGHDRVRQSLGPQLIGINGAFNNAPMLKGFAQMLWPVGTLAAAFNIMQDPAQLPAWLFGYPVVVDVLLRIVGSSIPGLTRERIGELMGSLKWPLQRAQSEELVWYQLGNGREEIPKIVEAVVAFDVLERMVTKIFSNGQPNRFGGQIERFLFRYANMFRPALQGWLFRYLQANPEGLRGTVTVFPWQQTFELHMRSRPVFWRSALLGLNARVPEDDKNMKTAISQLASDLGSLPSIWSNVELRSRRGCEFLLQWVSDFRIQK